MSRSAAASQSSNHAIARLQRVRRHTIFEKQWERRGALRRCCSAASQNACTSSRNLIRIRSAALLSSLSAMLISGSSLLRGNFSFSTDWVASNRSTSPTLWLRLRTGINTQEVQVKADAAVNWRKHESDYADSVDSKPWRYLLVPHDDIAKSKQLTDFLRFMRA